VASHQSRGGHPGYPGGYLDPETAGAINQGIQTGIRAGMDFACDAYGLC